MVEKTVTVDELYDRISEFSAGDKVLLSGTVYTARDAAHLRLCNMIANDEALPFELCGAVIYFAGPTPTKKDGTIGSFGPTTSVRMDKFSPILLDNGLLGMIGKGDRADGVTQSIVRNKSIYFCAGGGLGALISKSITDVEEIAFPELGCESIKRLSVVDMPLIVAIDSYGNSIFNRNN